MLAIDKVISLHEKIITATGGSPAIRDMDCLESALTRPLVTFDGVDLYPTEINKIAAIVHSLIANHGFVDGNKRTGVIVMLYLLNINNIHVNISQEELVELGLAVASGKMNDAEISKWIAGHLQNGN